MNWPVETVQFGDAHAIDAVRELWTAYWNSLGLPLEFQDFKEELRGLPGKYALPAGRLFLVRVDEEPAATAAFRPRSSNACEAKRLYVHEPYRHRGIAAALLAKLIEEARNCGYRHLYADTLPTMTSALVLYRKMGFSEVEAYSESPTPNAIYLHRSLKT